MRKHGIQIIILHSFLLLGTLGTCTSPIVQFLYFIARVIIVIKSLFCLDKQNKQTKVEKRIHISRYVWANKSKIKMSKFWIDLWKKNRDDETMIVDN